MEKLNYCVNCLKIFIPNEKCEICGSANIRELTRKSPVNIMGTKFKGRVLDVKEGMVKILFEGEKRVKSIKEYEFSKLKKIL